MSSKEKQAQRRECALDRLQETLEVGLRARLDQGNLNRFQAYASRIDLTYATFEENHFNLSLLAVSEEEKKADKLLRQRADSLYFDILALKKELESNKEGEKDKSPPPVGLPKISLPIFSGEFKLWPSFHELYESMIHRNEDIGKVEKFYYLLSSLKGEAQSLLKGITVSEANYDDAYGLLVKRYQNKRRLAFSYWEELKGFQLKGEDARDLRKLLDAFSENTCLLRNLGFPVESWDFLLFHTLLTKLDPQVRQRFEQTVSNQEIPSYQCLLEFLTGYCQSLELCSNQAGSRGAQRKGRPEYPSAFMAQVDAAKNGKELCGFCEEAHRSFACAKFKSQSPAERYKMVLKHGLCLNCGGQGHQGRDCAEAPCGTCKKKPHSLLHFPKVKKKEGKPLTTLTNSVGATSAVLLATAIIEVRDQLGRFQTVRALLDSGSQASFITAQCCKRLQLKPTKSRFSVCGLGAVPSMVVSSVVGTFRSRYAEGRELVVDMLVLPQICQDLPAEPVPTVKWSVVRGLPLADPGFGSKTKVDMLLGAEVFGQVVTGRRREGRLGEPAALETWFGWCLLGGYDTTRKTAKVVLHAMVDCRLETLVKQFWEIDSLQGEKVKGLPVEVERRFKETVFRVEGGRFGVALPFKGEAPEFPNSRALALRRLFSLERKLSRDRGLARAYQEFMHEYEQAGHMQKLEEGLGTPEDGYYIPHHPVLRPESSTAKLRVVFDASAKASNGVSLNDVVEVGPSLQLKIVAILLRFRCHSVGFMADIRQMYRQILVRQEDRKYQKIVWRESTDQPIGVYQLNTVTYGVASSPFLAIRTLHEVAARGKDRYPEAARLLIRDVYMDDTVSGAESVSQALGLQKELTALLKEGQFILHKWASNAKGLVTDHADGKEVERVVFESEDPSYVKVLGLKWETREDYFSFKVCLKDDICTKRTMLSNLARIFDPLGLISPVTFFAKAMFQRLWIVGTSWDDPAPEGMRLQWQDWLDDLLNLRKVRVPRFLGLQKGRGCIQLHGFCDASEQGYAAVVYLRLEDRKEVRCSLLAAKTKVAPIKQKSMPRLELCAAVLLSDLLAYIRVECSDWLTDCSMVAWSDSTTVLYWLQSRAFQFKPFVGHRVGRIQEVLPPGTFRYVPTKENPADVASRGSRATELLEHKLWWNGPSWLTLARDAWPTLDLHSPPPTELLECKRVICGLGLSSEMVQLIDSVSTLSRLLRLVELCLRFKHNCQARKLGKPKEIGGISYAQQQEALMCFVRLTQEEAFAAERKLVSKEKKLPKGLQALNLFVDSAGILRVGGRLGLTSLDYARKFPMLLPRKSRLTELIIDDCHRRHLHPGLQTVHFLLRQRFWILSPRRAIRAVLSKCIQCFRANPRALEPKMGELPLTRVSEVKAFTRVGIDFGGPFVVRPVKGRGRKVISIYICVFVCHATKAIHLEIVFDLTSEAVIAALRRFMARRGYCNFINCDKGTNFVGAKRIIARLMREASEAEGVVFQFNPPRAPHFGGLFEAGVKSVKTHLTRVTGKQILTLEEFLTFSTQVEAVLNSRPLWGVSSDARDVEVLTPGHFLMVAPLTDIADPDLSSRPLNTLSRWQLVQRLQQAFWGRWRNEYLTTLQQRQKWRVGGPTVREGAVVIVKEDQVKPRFWELGRIVSLHPGKDGIARVATIKTKRGEFKRPVVRLCPLPLATSGEE